MSEHTRSKSKSGCEDSVRFVDLPEHLKVPYKTTSIPPQILKLLSVCLNMDPSLRPKSAAEILVFLESIPGLEHDAHTPSKSDIGLHWPRTFFSHRQSGGKKEQFSEVSVEDLCFVSDLNNIGIILKLNIEKTTPKVGTIGGRTSTVSDAMLLDASVKCFEAALQIEPSSPVVLQNLGHAFFLQGRYSESIEVYQRCETYLNSGELQINLALSYDGVGQLDDALSAYQAASALLNGNVGVMSNCGIIYLQKGQYKQAEQILTSAMNADLSNYNIAYNLGLALYFSEKMNEAIEVFESCLQHNPLDFDALCCYGMAFTKLERFHEALFAFRKAAKCRPDNTGVLFNLGYCCMKAHLYDEALVAFEEVLENDPSDMEAINLIGDILSLLGRQDHAVEKYLEAQRLHSKDLLTL